MAPGAALSLDDERRARREWAGAEFVAGRIEVHVGRVALSECTITERSDFSMSRRTAIGSVVTRRAA